MPDEEKKALDVDWRSAKTEVIDTLLEGMTDLIQGAAADIDAYVASIGQDMVLASAGGRVLDQEHLEAQLPLLAAIHQVRITQKANETIFKIVGVASRVLTAGLTTGLAAVATHIPSGERG